MKFCDVLEIRNGKNQRKVENPNGKYPIYGSGGIMGWADDYICPANTVIIGRKGSINNPIYADTPFWNVDTAFGLVAKPEILLPKYLYYFCCSFNFETLNTTVTIPSLTKVNLLQIDIDMPSLEEQQKVVETLDCIVEAEKILKDQISHMDDLVKSRFIEMFGDLYHNPMGWTVKSFTDCATIESNMIHDFTGYEDLPHIGIDSIEKNTGVLRGYRTVREDGIISGKYLFTPKHIIYSKIRPNLNKVALPDFEGVCSADSYAILPKENVCNRIFLAHVMRSPMFLDYILPFSNRTNLPKVNRKQVEGFNLPTPPVALQNQFADFVALTDKSELVIRELLEKHQLMKEALMQEYFG